MKYFSGITIIFASRLVKESVLKYRWRDPECTKTSKLAMDLGGTLTQHKTPLCQTHREILFQLSKKYTLLMVGAGQVMRIFNQLEQFPIDIIGNYGMQYGRYNTKTQTIDLVRDITIECHTAQITKKSKC